MALPATSPNPILPAALTDRFRAGVALFDPILRQPALRRALPSVLVLTAAGLAAGLWLMLRAPDMTPIYPGMAEADKQAVLQSLTTAGIAAKVDTSTGNITVPTDSYHNALMTLAAQGLPQSTPDASAVLNNIPMGESRSVEAVRLRQAQEVDLARSITSIVGVQAARVHLALAEPSAFLRDNQPPRASVFLQLLPGRVLDRSQVEAIVNLVSSAVTGMAREDVTVVDQMGRLLSQGTSDAGNALGDQEMQRQIEMETLYRDRITALLAPIVGPDNLSVQVTMDMDFTHRQITEEKVDPNGSALLSEQTQVSDSTVPQAKGIPGAVSNTPPATPALSPTAPGGQQQQQAAAATPAPVGTGAVQTAASDSTTAGGTHTEGSTKNFQVSRSVQTTEPAGPQILRISAAIVVRADQPTTPVKAGAPAAPLIPPEKLADLQNLAKSAIGFDQQRGDTVTVIAQPFADTIENAMPASSGLEWLPELLRQLGLVGGLAVVSLGVLRPLLGRMMATSESASAAPGEDDTEAANAPIEVGEGETLDLVKVRLERRRQKLAESALGASASREEKFAILRQIAADDPNRIASVLQRMMKKDMESA